MIPGIRSSTYSRNPSYIQLQVSHPGKRTLSRPVFSSRKFGQLRWETSWPDLWFRIRKLSKVKLQKREHKTRVAAGQIREGEEQESVRLRREPEEEGNFDRILAIIWEINKCRMSEFHLTNVFFVYLLVWIALIKPDGSLLMVCVWPSSVGVPPWFIPNPE